jgi:HD superfamily phosphodiesterase
VLEKGVAGNVYFHPMKKIIQQYAKDLTAGRLASGYEHSYRIYHLAREIGGDLDYDDEVLHASCFLHDIDRMVDHPRGSAEKAEAILVETGFPPEKIPSVVEAILHHMPGAKAVSPEGRLLHDANVLDSIGAVGFARLSIGAFFWYHYKRLQDIIGMLEGELENADNLYYAKSRKLAELKVVFVNQAITQLKQELRL